MPETRYTTETSYPKGLTAEEKTLDRAIITKIPYEVSDEELAEEAEASSVRLIIEQLPDKGINKAWKRLIKKGILP